MSKLRESWERYVATIPGLNNVVAPTPLPAGDSEVAYEAALSVLPSDVVNAIQDVAAEQTEELKWEHAIEHHWCLCEMIEGDFPRVFAFPNPQRLVEAIAKREGDETAVWPLYGIPLQLTQAVPHPQREGELTRYLLLPNQLAAVVSRTEPYRLVEQSLLPDNLELQEEGWLGDPEMMQGQSYYIDGIVDDEDPDEDYDSSQIED
jgi:hypothetical protein